MNFGIIRRGSSGEQVWNAVDSVCAGGALANNPLLLGVVRRRGMSGS